MNKGFITISRTIREHWLSNNSDYLRAWVFILLTANYREGKLALGSKIYPVKRGQCTLSMRSWANEFRMSVKSTETFFKLLEQDDMIKRSVLGKGKQSTTLITIVNYNVYQLFVETLEKRKGIARETLEEHDGNAKGVQYNKGNKGNNVNKETIYIQFDHLKLYADEFKKLSVDYTKAEVDSVLMDIENYSGNKKYKSLYLTALKWLKKNEASKSVPLTPEHHKIKMEF